MVFSTETIAVAQEECETSLWKSILWKYQDIFLFVFSYWRFLLPLLAADYLFFC